MNPLIVIVTGGRDYPHWDHINTTLNHVHQRHGIAKLIEGGASGADAGARQWALDNGVINLTFQAEWGKYGKAAGPIRNHAMLQHAITRETLPTMVIAFPGGIGTAGMVELAKSAYQAGYKVFLCDLREHLGGDNYGSAVGQAAGDPGLGEQTRTPDDRQPGIKRAH